MVYPCAASSKMALPTVLRSIFRAEFASELRPQGSIYDQSKRLSLCQVPQSRQLQSQRPFSSFLRLQIAESRQSTSSNESDASHDHKPVQKSQLKTKPVRSGRNLRDAKSKDHKSRSAYQPLKKKREGWQIQKEALQHKFQEGWNPPKKLSPDALDGIRQLHTMAPDRFTTPVLAAEFKVSPEAIRRILKSKWQASEEQMEDRRQRWEKRHDRIWSQMAELGLRPKRAWTEEFDDAKVLYEDSANKP